jgi:glucokinase
MVKDKSYSIGVDIGGTKMAAVLFDGKSVMADYSLATPKDNVNNFLTMLFALIEPLRERAKLDKAKIRGLGLGIAGTSNYREGLILRSPNNPVLDGLKIIERVKEKVEREWEVKIDNDANCFARAEARIGAGKKYKNVFGITVGTGIGGGWFYNGDIYYGARGSSREPGMMIIDFATGISLEEGFHKITQNNPGILAAEAYKGDPLAEKAYDEVAKILGTAFANIAILFEPDVIVVGGGVMDSSDLFIPKAKKIMKQYIKDPVAKEVPVVKAKLDKLAGAIGAAMLVS